MDIRKMTALQTAAAVKTGKITVREALAGVLAAVDEKENEIHAYLALKDRESLEKEADALDEAIRSGAVTGPLAGVPVAVKDNLCYEGLPCTCASRILEGFRPAYTAEAVSRLEKAGALILGKTNMDEFAMGSTTETSAFGPTKNPVNTGHVPGGSSGGSAAAVAAGEALAALGSDTGGSIRQPASYCGVVGLKPTYGTVSRYGLVAYGSSLDQIGPITADVADAAAMLEAIAGRDVKDATSLERQDGRYTDALICNGRGLKIAIPEEYLGDGLNDDVRQEVLKAADVFRAAGAVVETVSLKYTDYAVASYYTIADAEASSNLERYDGVKYGFRAEDAEDLHTMYKRTRSRGFGPEVKRRIMLGSFVLSSGYYDAYYLKALRVRALIRKAFDEIFADYDLILGPASPTTAPSLGSSLQDAMTMYLSDIYTVPANLAGIPGICVPCGADRGGLPVGLQLMAAPFREHTLIRAAYTYEQTVRGKEAIG